jgi:hypothetical protein
MNKTTVAMITIMGSAILSLTGCNSKKSVSQKYNSLLSYLNNFSLYSCSSVDSLLNELPDDYKEVSSIRSEYYTFRKDVKVIEDARLTDAESDNVRTSFIKLLKANSSNIYWDISAFLTSSYVYEKVIFGYEWNCYSGMFFYHENPEGQNLTWLSTSLPTNKDEAKEYYFYINKATNGLVFGYTNQSDSNDKFDSFIVNKVSLTNEIYLSISLYCYANKTTYSLS